MSDLAPVDVGVRPVQDADRERWLAMWAGYCAFYRTVVAPEVTESTWRRLFDDRSTIGGLIAFRPSSGETIGFAHYVVHPFTWSSQSACYLEDLFVESTARRSGAGGALIEHLIQLCKEQRWARLYWMTQQSNTTAQRLYDRYATADDFIRYIVEIA